MTIPRGEVAALRHVSRYTGRRPIFVGPGLKLAPGTDLRVVGTPVAAFSLDLASDTILGLHWGDRQWVVIPEVGYSWRSARREHLVLAGLGVGRGHGDSAPRGDARTMFGGWYYLVRAVQEFGPEQGRGVRHGLTLDALENGFTVELSHQLLLRDDTQLHSLHANVGLDFGLLFLRGVLQ